MFRILDRKTGEVMKVLDPQAALLTNAEVLEFFKSNKTRPADPRIGAYRSVNLHNYGAVRQDLEAYLKTITPNNHEQPVPETWMTKLMQRLKPYELTKTEIFELINLGVGLDVASSSNTAVAPDQEEVNGDEASTEQDGAEDEKDEEGDDEQEEASDGSLDRMLFGLVVEEVDERFAGEDGEHRIASILNIFKETVTGVEGTEGQNGRNGE